MVQLLGDNWTCLNTYVIDGTPYAMKVARTVQTGRNPKGQTRNGEITLRLDKAEYTVDEDITISGTVIKDKIGLADVDITLKLIDNEGQVILVEQIKTDVNGKFTDTFKVPEETEAGIYALTVKANDPVNKSQEKKITIVS